MGQKGMDPVAMQMNIRNNTMEMQDCIKDLYKWEADMHKKEEQLKKAKASQGQTAAPPIRGKAPPEVFDKPKCQKRPCSGSGSQKKASQKQGAVAGATGTAAEHTYDYFKDRWDKFDVDAALAEVDQPPSSGKEPLAEVVEAGNGNVQEVVPVRAPKSPEEDRDMWKGKGNEFFKLGDFHRAKECYSSSLAALESNAAYTNRALACIKLKEWQQAEDDCTKVINSDPGNLKAWQRRAEARKGKGDALGHVQDLDAALKLAPDSTAISSQLRQALPKYLNRKGLSMPSKRAAVHAGAHLNDPEPHISPHTSLQKQDKPQPSPQHDHSAESSGKSEECSATEAVGERERVEAAHTHEAAPCRNTTTEGVDRRDTSGADAASCSASAPEAQGDSSDPGSGGGSRPSSASSAPVKRPQVQLPVVETYIPSAAPANSAEFECRWRAIRGDQGARSSYLDLIDPTSLVPQFGSALTPDVLEGVVRTLLTAIKGEQDGEKAARRGRMLRELTRVQRFSMNLMLVAKAAKQTLAALWDECIKESSQDSIKVELLEVKKLYKL